MLPYCTTKYPRESRWHGLIAWQLLKQKMAKKLYQPLIDRDFQIQMALNSLKSSFIIAIHCLLCSISSTMDIGDAKCIRTEIPWRFPKLPIWKEHTSTPIRVASNWTISHQDPNIQFPVCSTYPLSKNTKRQCSYSKEKMKTVLTPGFLSVTPSHGNKA